ncbi:MAG: hypothetical protein DU429_03640 [Candidatus Tokpelaia sp.]|nr:MAG: hypothetical protein DU430_01500 [Candidatus Tokpelaia sp.]KAA6207193.1 MAG: hypothetical protein DU429_03640 [Candidatus Tokpelaia sp.]
MVKGFHYKNWLVITALIMPVAACAPLRGVFSHKSGASVGGMAVPGQSLPGQEAGLLSTAEKDQAAAAEYQALEYKKAGEAVPWGKAGARASGIVTPGQPYRVGTQNCRQYSHNWVINGVPHVARGSACRNEDGSWTPLV